jgi:DNA polymerase-1
MVPNTNKTLVLLDGHSNIFKAYHAIRDQLTNSKGEPTSAVYGFINAMLRLVRTIGSPYFVVVFDPPGESFRSSTYAEYKANRPPMPQELRDQEKRIRQMLKILKVPVVELAGFEADDVIGALALRALENGGEALVCSVDKDLLQLVRPGLRVWREHLQKLEVLETEGVIEKMGVRPEQVAAYLGLVGDSSDNIPGVPGVGAKTAAALLNEFGTLEAILEAAPTLTKKKISESLVANREAALLSRDLATLRTDCVTDFNWDAFRWSYEPSQALREFYREMEFQNLLKELGGETLADRTTRYSILHTRAELNQLAEQIRTAGVVALDTETSDLEPLTADLVGISLSWELNQAAYIPLGHGSSAQAKLSDVQATLGPLLSDSSIRWVGHNWGYDSKMLMLNGLPAPVAAGDTMIGSYLLNPERSGTQRLKDLAVQWLGIQMTEITELIGDESDLVTMASVTTEKAADYACQDADATLQLHRHFEPKLEEAHLSEVYRTLELPLVNVIASMELEGIRIDARHFQRLSRESEKALEAMTGDIYAIAGRPFKINSPKQVAELLFDELDLPSEKKGKSGQRSTDVSVLESISHLHSLPAKLLEYRQLEKLKNTYTDPLPTMVHPKTGKIHTSFNQTIAATGRLSSSNPNLQNIPVRTEAGRGIRAGFIPRGPGWKLLAADYSQIELRILAHLSGDASLLEAFTSGSDVHTLTASKVFGIPLAEVSREQRTQAKAINFGIIYGMSQFRLGKDLGISQDAARRFIEDYFRIYSGVHRFIEETKRDAKRDGFVTTLLGRRRFVSDINSRNFQNRSFAERVAVNTPIQGTSADMIKAAMIRVHARLQRENLRARMVLQVHDELIFDTPEEEIEVLTGLVREEMAGALPLRVPIQVDVEVGNNWAEC